MANMQMFFSKNLIKSISYNKKNTFYDIDKALEAFYNQEYESVYSQDFEFNKTKDLEFYLHIMFSSSQNIDGPNWNKHKPYRSSSVGDIFVIINDGFRYFYIVASFGFDLIKKEVV